MSSTKYQINNLKYGELHFYYSLKFNTDLSFSDLCDTLQKSNICFNEEYQQQVIDSLGTSLANITSDFQSQNSISDSNNSVSYIVKDNSTGEKYKPTLNNISPYVINGDNIRLEISSSTPSISLNVYSTELESLQERLLKLKEEYEQCKTIYGNSFVDNQDRILLLPIKATLTNGESVWIHALLFVFRNNTGILKLEMPLTDIDIAPLKNNDINSFVKSIENCWDIDSFSQDIKLSTLSRFYIKQINDATGINIINYNNEIRNIILIDFNGLPKRIDSMPNEIQEELYRIISAPVPDYSFTSYTKEAQEYIEKHSWGAHGIKYITKINGGLLSIIDQSLLDYIITNFKENENISNIDEDDYFNICSSIAKDVNINVEFAILIIMLKKLNECNDMYNKTQKKYDINKIRKEFYQNILFINDLQSSCYGTVCEQTSELEKMMPLYLKSETNAINQKAINNILNDEIQQSNKDFMDFISIVTLLFTIIFGLPSILEAITILRKNLLYFITTDIPFVTLENTSILIWVFLNALIILKISKKKRNKYNET